MSIDYNILLRFITILTASWFIGCADPVEKEETVDDPPTYLTVEPAGPQEVGYFEQMVFTVLIKDENNQPLAGVPVVANLIGKAHNASLEPAQFITEKDGTGQVTFIAPDLDVSFEIRFKSPKHENYIPITVASLQTKMTLHVDYPANRAFSMIEAHLFEATDTFDCDELTGSLSIDSLQDLRGITPTTFEFVGVRENGTYAVSVVAQNRGEIRATGCVAGISPTEQPQTLILTNVPLNVAGMFDIITELDTSDEVDKLVQAFSSGILFIPNPSSAILDGIQAVLAAEDQFAAESFVEQREEIGADAYLDANYFAVNELDVGGKLIPVWEAMKFNLTGFKAVGTLELETAGSDDFNIRHTLNYLQFPRTSSSIDLDFPIENPDIGSGSARIGGEEWPDDTLIIEPHVIHLGLGEPLNFLFIEALDFYFGTKDFSEVLELIVDCTAVAEILEEPLSNVVARSTIEEGCKTATTQARNALMDHVTALNQYNVLTFEGECALEIQNRVDRLIDGEFDVSWGITDDELYEMEATFKGDRVLQR